MRDGTEELPLDALVDRPAMLQIDRPGPQSNSVRGGPLNLKAEDIDKAAIVKLREQLWAQAYAAYTAWVGRQRPESECPLWLDLEEVMLETAVAETKPEPTRTLPPARFFRPAQHFALNPTSTTTTTTTGEPS